MERIEGGVPLCSILGLVCPMSYFDPEARLCHNICILRITYITDFPPRETFLDLRRLPSMPTSTWFKSQSIIPGCQNVPIWASAECSHHSPSHMTQNMFSPVWDLSKTRGPLWEPDNQEIKPTASLFLDKCRFSTVFVTMHTNTHILSQNRGCMDVSMVR